MVGAQVSNVDLVIVRFDDDHSVIYGRCLHRGALMVDGSVSGDNLICGLHGWDYLFQTGVSSYDNAERLAKFSSWLEGDDLCVDQDEIETWEQSHPQPYDRAAYQGGFQDPHGDPAEPHVSLIRRLADEGLEYLGHHGPVTSMGVSREQLPKWDDIQFVTRKPQLDEVSVATDVVIGPNADKPLKLAIPLFVSDMSYGALSEEAKVALARGAELAGTGICSGEGGVLPEEHAENSRYFYELASGKFGCIGMRACSSNNCPVGIATQKPELRARLPVELAAQRLHKFFSASAELMTVLARACGHTRLSEFCTDDLTTYDRDMAHLTEIAYGGVSR